LFYNVVDFTLIYEIGRLTDLAFTTQFHFYEFLVIGGLAAVLFLVEMFVLFNRCYYHQYGMPLICQYCLISITHATLYCIVELLV